MPIPCERFSPSFSRSWQARIFTFKYVLEHFFDETNQILFKTGKCFTTDVTSSCGLLTHTEGAKLQKLCMYFRKTHNSGYDTVQINFWDSHKLASTNLIAIIFGEENISSTAVLISDMLTIAASLASSARDSAISVDRRQISRARRASPDTAATCKIKIQICLNFPHK